MLENFLYKISWFGYKIGKYRIYVHNRKYWNVILENKYYSFGPIKIVKDG